MVHTTDSWNNDLSNDNEERELTDHDFERNEDKEQSHVYSPFSPFYNEIKAPSMKDLFDCLNPKI